METQPSADSIELEPDLAPGMEPEEGSLNRRLIKRTAAQQGTTIPAGWRPTVRAPVPVVRCNHIFKDGHAKQGQRCEQWSLRGALTCYVHGGRGNLKNVEAYRQSIIEAARLRLTESVPDAMEWLIDLGANSTADNVRLKAATEILDRAGIKTAEQLEVNLSVSETTPALTLAQRLDTLRKAATDVQRREEEEQQRLALPAGDETADPAEIIDAEIVPTPEDDG